jgi:hypothetical protein
MFKVLCVRNIEIPYGVVAFTEGKTYEFKKHNSTDGVEVYVAKNDMGADHLMGNLTDGWFKKYFELR